MLVKCIFIINVQFVKFHSKLLNKTFQQSFILTKYINLKLFQKSMCLTYDYLASNIELRVNNNKKKYIMVKN